MSYLTQANIADNFAMQRRVAQAAASERVPGDPDSWTQINKRTWAAAPGWDAAWESALAGDPDADPGANEAVITDAMILSQVQSMVNPPMTEPPVAEPTAYPGYDVQQVIGSTHD